jgi:CheY-like chemotaxis protein
MDYRDFGRGAAMVSGPFEQRPAGDYHGSEMSTLLIVDRDDALRSEVSRFLLSLGHAVREARECREALKLAGEQSFDLLICQLPAEGSWEELLRAARARNPGAALIAQVDPDAAAEGQRALDEGAAALLAKPYSLPELNF